MKRKQSIQQSYRTQVILQGLAATYCPAAKTVTIAATTATSALPRSEKTCPLTTSKKILPTTQLTSIIEIMCTHLRGIKRLDAITNNAIANTISPPPTTFNTHDCQRDNVRNSIDAAVSVAITRYNPATPENAALSLKHICTVFDEPIDDSFVCCEYLTVSVKRCSMVAIT